ncbi:MAG TPA: hypothetical protein VG984_01535 [Candidatus Paceibacterota bacterium]|nr:hypothetical protein [Candidatus Paceibacterota bacterium]
MADIVTRDQYYYRGSFIAGIINTVVGIIELFLLIRIVLELLGANAASPIVAWTYAVSSTFMGPFVGAFPGLYLTQNSILDVVAVVAMIGYALLGWLLIELLGFIVGTVERI